MILVGIIPGPKEPSLHVNTFLRPLVDELLILWDGEEMSLHSGLKQQIRAVLLCVACDIPAGKKVCGFCAFGSDYGCSRCFHKFPGSFGEKIVQTSKGMDGQSGIITSTGSMRRKSWLPVLLLEGKN